MAKSTARLAKLSRPVAPDVTHRDRLFLLLDDARPKPLIWVSGPPGGGKTTLVSSYLEARGCNCLWYQIDAEDLDPSAFFHYLGMALPGRRRRPLFNDDQGSDLAGTTRRFFRELFRQLPTDVLVVFDGCHQVPDDSPLHDILREAVGQVPPGASLVILSRNQPPSGTVGLRAAGRLATLDWDTLRLTRDEVAQLARVDLPAAAALHAACDGWPAGLRLLMGVIGPDRQGTVPRPIDPRHLDDYFSLEVFDRQPSGVQEFMLRTSVVSDLTPSLAAALSGDRLAGQTLERLHREHVFTARLGDTPSSYRYHDLFRTYLRERAQRVLRQHEIDQLFAKAARWYGSHGRMEHAVTAYLDATEWLDAARLICEEGPRLIVQGRHSTVRQWLGRIPGFLVERSGELLMRLGESLMPLSPARAREAFERAGRRFEADRDDGGRAVASAGVLQTYYFEQDDFHKLDPWMEVLRGLLERELAFPAPDSELRVWSTLQMAMTLRRPSDPFLPRCASRVLELLARPIESNQRVRAATLLLVYLDWFQCADAPSLVGRVQAWLDEPDLALFEKAWWRLAEFHHFRQRGDTQAARQAFARWQAIHAEADLRVPEIPTMLAELWELSANGGARRSDALMTRLLNLAGYASLRPQERILLGSLHAEHLVQKQDFRAAADSLISTLSMAEALGCEGAALQLQVCSAIAHACTGDLVRARSMLALMASRLPSFGATRLRFAAQLAEALLEYRAGNPDAGDDVLAKAFEIGRQEGYESTFLWLPWMMTELAGRAVERSIEVAYARRLIRARGLRPPRNRPREWPWAVTVRCLGDFEIRREDEPITFNGKAPKRSLDLLRALVARGGTRVDADELAELLWPDSDGDSAADAFAMALHRLRKLLGSDSVLSMEDGKLSLNPDQCWVDIWAFEAAAGAVRDLETLEGALDLYPGHFLAGESLDAWALAARDRYRALALRLVERVAGDAAGRNDMEKAERAFRMGLDIDTLWEPFHRGLIRCLIGMGRQAEAALAFDRCRELLVANLGVPPSTATESLLRGAAGA